MRVSHRSIRVMIFFLVVVPLLSLAGLYAFATTITARDAITLARSATVRNAIAGPIGFFGTDGAMERQLAITYLAWPAPKALPALHAQEARTDGAGAVVRAAATSAGARSASSARVKAALAALLKDAAGLPLLRSQVSSRTVSRSHALNAYSATISAGYNAITQALLQMANDTIVTQSPAAIRTPPSLDQLPHD